MNVGFDGTDGLAQNRRDLGISAALDVSQHDGAAIAYGKPREGGSEFAKRLMPLGLPGRSGAGLRDVERELRPPHRSPVE